MILDEAEAEDEEPPERIASEADRLGHVLAWDDPAPVRAVKRWTCTRCRESAWCDARDPSDIWGPGVLSSYCRGKPLGPEPAPYAWATGRKHSHDGPPP